MAQKRKAGDAFNKPNGGLSAFAVAQQRKRLEQSAEQIYDIEADRTAEGPANQTGPVLRDEIPTGAIAAGDVQGDEGEIRQPVTSQPLSTFSPVAGNVLCDDEERLEIVLKRGEIVAVIGTYELLVLKGALSAYGAILRPDSGRQLVYAPSIQALPSLLALKDGVTLRIRSIQSKLLDLEKLSPLFRNIWNAPEQSRSFDLLVSTAHDPLRRSLHGLAFDEEMKKLLAQISAKVVDSDRDLIIMTVGAKSSGKSTVSRAICNWIHTTPHETHSLYLDLDPGQPEFGPAGQVSLVELKALILGPPLTHAASVRSQSFRIIRSHTLAATSFKDDPEHYMACAADLFQHAIKHRGRRKLSIIVNSSGWIAGLGARVQVDLVKCLRVSDIILLDPTEEFSALLTTTPSVAIHRLQRRPVAPFSRTPAEMRAMQTMAYFHQRQHARTGEISWSDTLISAVRPWKVSYSGADAGILAVFSYGHMVAGKFLAEVLDGSIVALVVPEDPGLVHPDAVERTAAEGIPFAKPDANGVVRPLDPRRSHCVGLALVRGIDVQAQRFLLVTPLVESQIAALLRQQIVLVRGGFDPPEWAYLEDLHTSPNRGRDAARDIIADDRPWVSRGGLVGIESAVWRLRHPPTPSSAGNKSSRSGPS